MMLLLIAAVAVPLIMMMNLVVSTCCLRKFVVILWIWGDVAPSEIEDAPSGTFPFYAKYFSFSLSFLLLH
jgi:hypothetical protein